MSETTNEFLLPYGPSASATASASKTFNIALAATTNVPTDLTGAAYAGLATAINNGRLITLVATVDIWYRWDTASGTVDETKTAAVTPANQGVFMPAGSSKTERPPIGSTWLIAKATPSAGTLCVYVSSKSPIDGMKF